MPSKITSIAGAIPQISKKPMTDKTPPPHLSVSATFGDLVLSSTPTPRPRDPLALDMENVEPDCHFEILNLSAKPDASWTCSRDRKVLPGRSPKHMDSGRYAVIFGDKQMQKLGLKAGDTFEIRQVDRAGNASEPERVELNNYDSLSVDNRRGDWQSYGITLRKTNYRCTAIADARAPTAIAKRMKLEPSDNANMAILSADRALEPGCIIEVVNERTRNEYSDSADSTGSFSLSFDAAVGDPLHIKATDHNGNTKDLGHIVYAPSSFKAGSRRSVGRTKPQHARSKFT